MGLNTAPALHPQCLAHVWSLAGMNSRDLRALRPGRAKIDRIKPGSLQGYWPEVNVLVPAGCLDPSGVPDYNAIVEVFPANRAPEPQGGYNVVFQPLADVIKRVSELVSENPEISEVDLNPVFADGRGATAADVRRPLRVKQPHDRPT